MFRKQVTFTVLSAMVALVFTASDAEAGRRHRRHNCCHGGYQQTSYSQNSRCDAGNYGYSSGYSTSSGCGTTAGCGTSSGCGTSGCACGACGVPVSQASYSTGSSAGSYQTDGSYQSGQNQSGQMGGAAQSNNINRNDVNRNTNPNNLNRDGVNHNDVNVNGQNRINAGRTGSQGANADVNIVEPPAPATSNTVPDAPTPDVAAPAPAPGN